MFNRCHVPRLTTMLDDKEEKAPGVGEANVDKDKKHKRKRTGAVNTDSYPSSTKRLRVLSVTPDDAAPVVTVSGDQVQGSSTNTNTQQFLGSSSLRVSHNENEVKLNPTKAAGATKSKLNNGDNLSIKHFFKPVTREASVADNFYPPD